MIDPAIINQMTALTHNFTSGRKIRGQFSHYRVLTEVELDQVIVAPPAVAYVEETNDVYFRHGPEYWFGNIGTAEKGWNDREEDRWVRATYTGKRAIIQATHLSEISSEAFSALFLILIKGPDDYEPGEYGSTYWKAVETLYLMIINTTFIELNTGTCGKEGVQLYDIAEGDICIENGAQFVQERSKLLSENPKRFGYPFNLLATKALTEGTPGLHPFFNTSREEYMSIHPERMGYVVTKQAHSKGATQLRLSVYPKSVPSPTYGTDPKRWVDRITQYPFPYFREGCGAEERQLNSLNIDLEGTDWYLNTFCFIALPETFIPIKVNSVSYSGGDYPYGTKVTVSLDDPYPCPLLVPLGAYCPDPQPYWNMVAPVRSAFSFKPIGIYGDIGQTSITGYINPRSRSGRLGWTSCRTTAGNSLDLYNPAVEGWGGMRGHSPLRGLSEGDKIHMPEDNAMYDVIGVSKNPLENPSSMRLNKDTHLLEDYHVNVYGVSVGPEIEWYPQITDNTVISAWCPWTPPEGDSGGMPIIVKSISNGVATLMAPLPCDLPANTRMNLYSAKDNHMTTYAYYDYHEFCYRLAKYNKIHDDLRDKITDEVLRLQELLRVVDAYYKEAQRLAATEWFRPPYFRLIPLRTFKWSDTFDHYGTTYPEVITNLQAQIREVWTLGQTGLPPILIDEYISILDYKGV